MAKVIFITGNQGKADFLAKFLDYPVDHLKLELDEPQSLDYRKITEHKVREAYKKVQKPVLVEDMGLSYDALGRLPGTLTKWFYSELGLEGMCRLLDGYKTRQATGEICFGYFDGKNVKLFEGKIRGVIADKPRGNGGFGWNPIFIPEGTNKTLAEMDDEETKKFSLRTTTVYPEIRKFLAELEDA
jgi:non-canonical purine NTP pyrophosphatase (RdgB/HAM1 family)